MTDSGVASADDCPQDCSFKAAAMPLDTCYPVFVYGFGSGVVSNWSVVVQRVSDDAVVPCLGGLDRPKERTREGLTAAAQELINEKLNSDSGPSLLLLSYAPSKKRPTDLCSTDNRRFREIPDIEATKSYEAVSFGIVRKK